MLDGYETIDLVMAASIFMLILSLWIGGVTLWSIRRGARAARMQERLGSDEPEPTTTRTLHLWHGGRRESIDAPATASRGSLGARLQRQCDRAGWAHGPVAALLIVCSIVLVCGGGVALVSGNLMLGGGVAVALLVVLRLQVGGRIAKRESLFETQLTDAMDLAARSLRAGHPLPGAFQLIAEETNAPVKTIFAELCQRHGMGVGLEESLREVALTTSSPDMKLFATSVGIQMRVGGNLADLIDRLAKVMRERMRLNRRLNVLTAQTQLSKRLLVSLPFLVFILFNVINPDYMRPFYDTTVGHRLLAIGVAGLSLGTLIMNKMAVLRY